MGQTQARFAVEVAAAGAHHLMLTGPPGIGKTMLAQRLPGLLPPLTDSEALEVTAIHSVAGLLADDTPLITRPPFVAPHHTSSVAALVGGGSGMARPGAVSRAHRGVLFLDECAEIGTQCAGGTSNAVGGRRDPAGPPRRCGAVSGPVPAGPGGQPVPVRARRPARLHVRGGGQAALSGSSCPGPLLDRVDLRVQMYPVRAGAFHDQDGEPTTVVRQRVAAARNAAAERWRAIGVRTNAEVPGPLLRRTFSAEP